MSDQEFIFAATRVDVRFTIQPIDLLFNSMFLVTYENNASGLAEWVENTREAMSPEQQRNNGVVMDILIHGIEPVDPTMTFPEYLEYLNAADPCELRDRILNGLRERCNKWNPEAGFETDDNRLLADKAVFIDMIERGIGVKYAEKRGEPLDLELYEWAFNLLNDPASLHTLVVGHLTEMWEDYLQPEWDTKLPMLEESVEAFSAQDYSGLNALEIARTVTGRELSNVLSELENVSHLVLMPSLHLGPYISYFFRDEVLHLIYGVRMPEGVQPKSPMLSRSELLTRLNALADDTRLAILELLTHYEELFAQDIMSRLNLSQSSASRHLRQLTATGFLVEKRREVAKYYSLNRQRVEDTYQALMHFLHAQR
ncbi:MAG: ArsR/SmtB family transcription factor [Chloroflexota bacterium]